MTTHYREAVRLPNFLIIGAPKSGTSSLYQYLTQHPQIFMCFPKEPTFFGHEGESGMFNGPGDNDEFYRTRMLTQLDKYAELFRFVKDQKAVGDASIFHLYLRKAPHNIRKHVPRAPMFAVLRNPVDRAYSNYLHLRRQMREPLSFEDALKEEPKRIANDWNEFWHYRNLGLYYQQVKRYFDTCGRSQLHIYLYEDLKRDMLGVLRNMFQVLEVDTAFVPNLDKKFNVTFVPTNRLVGRAITGANRLVLRSRRFLPKSLRWGVRKALQVIERAESFNQTVPPPLSESVRGALTRDYREDILRLQDLLRRDLASWLEPSSQKAQASA